METLFTKPWLRALSGLSINISAGWFGVAFITPNFADISLAGSRIILTLDVLFGILFLLLTVKVEEMLEK